MMTMNTATTATTTPISAATTIAATTSTNNDFKQNFRYVFYLNRCPVIYIYNIYSKGDDCKTNVFACVCVCVWV